jgi:hypothetical protein
MVNASQMLITRYYNNIGRIKVSVVVSNVLDRGFNPRAGQTKDHIPRCMHWFARAKRYFYLCIIFSMRNHYRNSTKRAGLVQGRNHPLIKSNLFGDKADKVLIWL